MYQKKLRKIIKIHSLFWKYVGFPQIFQALSQISGNLNISLGNFGFYTNA
jgi:hypothetical protein